MKVTIPKKEITVCDVCKQESSVGIYTTCVVCGKEYCTTCEAIMAGCVHQPDVCKPCGKLEKVEAAVDRFVKPIVTVLKRRDTALRRIGRNL